MRTSSYRIRRNLRRPVVLIGLLLAVCLSAAPQLPLSQTGRPGASIEAAKAPAYVARRAKLMDIHKDGIIIVPSQYKARNGAMTDNKNFFYLTGLKEVDTVLVLDPGGNPRETIFRRSAGGSDPLEKPNTQLASVLFGITRSGRANRFLLPFSDFDFLSRAFAAMNPLAQAEALLNVDPTVAEMRLTKDAEEIAALREAINLTADGLKEAYRAAEPGVREVDLAAILRYAFDKRETEDSFLQAASGPNSTNVHFGATSRELAAGDLVVFDVGCWIRGYTSDISRTIPASGRFTREQRDIYALVLEAEKHGCRRLVPGVTFKAVQDEVEDILMAGLEKLGLVTDVKSPWQRRLYIQHGFGHGIGLDVHDVWGWHSPRLDKVAMAPGMVMTMEPGLYFPEARFETVLGTLKGKVPDVEIAAFREKAGPVYKKYVNLGVRIEDDVLITENGSEVLSGRVPKEIADIEKLMREKSPHNLLK